MIRGIIAITLALLIGNPVCCCALGWVPATAASSTAEKPLRPCCQQRAAAERQQQQAPETPAQMPCPCLSIRKFVATDQVTRPVPPTGIDLPLPLFCETAQTLPRLAFDRLAAGDHGPPGVVPPRPPVRVLYGVFRC